MARTNLGLDTSGRPLVVDNRTLAKLRAAEKALGHTFVITQGSWRGEGGAVASAGTHDRAGVVDLRTWDLPPSVSPQEAVLALRRAGLIAWYRTTAQGFEPHIHAIDYGNPDLAPSAARQVEAWKAGRNGLASNGPDDGPRIPIPMDPPREDDDDMPYTDWPQKDRDALVADLAKALSPRVKVPSDEERTVDLATAVAWGWHHARAANFQTKNGVNVEQLAAAVAAKVGKTANAKAIAGELLRQLSTEEK